MVKRLAWLVAVTAFCVTSAPAWAIEAGVDARLAFYRWEENVQPIAPQETGPMALVGGWVSGSPRPTTPSLRLRADVRLLFGYVHFDTALLSAPTVPRSTESVYLGSIQEGSVGWRIQRPTGHIEPFAALGYRWWLRHIQSNSTVTGYDEWYRVIVLRIGIRGELAISNSAALYGEFSGDPVLWAREDIDFNGDETLHVENGKRLGWTIETGLRTRVIEVGVYWQAMRLGQSTVDVSSIIPNCCLQPESDQDIIGVKVAVPFVTP